MTKQLRGASDGPTVASMNRVASRTAIFYGLMALALVALASRAHTHVLPSGLAAQVGHNSEALLFAILVAAEIQFLRPMIMNSRWRWAIAIGTATALFACAYALLQTGWTSSVVTLNEPIVAAAFIVLYITIRRPLRFAPMISVAILLGVVVFFDTEFVLDQAESLVPFMLAPLAFDVFERTLLEPDRPDRPALRLFWLGCLVVIGLGFMVLAAWARQDLQGSFRLAIDYGHRASEAYWGWILVHAYFGFWLRRKAPAHSASQAAEAQPSAESV